MDWQELLNMVYGFFGDPRVKTIVGLIFLDVVLGVGVAIKNKRFSWAILADFYRTNVLPYVIGYLGFYLAAKIMVADLLGEFGYIIGEGMVVLAWGAPIGNLVIGSIIPNVKALGYKVPE